MHVLKKKNKSKKVNKEKQPATCTKRKEGKRIVCING